MTPILSLLYLFLFNLIESADKSREQYLCGKVWTGCNLQFGSCICGKKAACTNMFTYNNRSECFQDLISETRILGFPVCKAAEYKTICDQKYAKEKYCYGDCNSCCFVDERGCLPPPNLYFPASYCQHAESEDPCETHTCSKGLVCKAVKKPCTLLPCKRVPECVVDLDYDPCKMVRCYTHSICLRKRRPCGKPLDECPFMHSCVPVSHLPNKKSIEAYQAPQHIEPMVCPQCPRHSLKKTFCTMDFAVRIRVLSVGKLWRWSPSAGKFYKIKIQIEYVFKGPDSITENKLSGHMLIRAKEPGQCACPPKLIPYQRYFVIGNVLSGNYLHVPSSGFVKSWKEVKYSYHEMRFLNRAGPYC